jgi:hypothetical protein
VAVPSYGAQPETGDADERTGSAERARVQV